MTTATSVRDLALRLLSAFDRRDAAQLHALLSPAVQLHVPGRNPMAGERVGRDAVLAFFAHVAVQSGQTERITVNDVLASDQRAAVLCTVTGERAGKTLFNQAVYIMHFEHEQLTDLRIHNYDQHHVDSFWV